MTVSDEQHAADVALLNELKAHICPTRDAQGVPAPLDRTDIHFLAELARCWKQTIESCQR